VTKESDFCIQDSFSNTYLFNKGGVFRDKGVFPEISLMFPTHLSNHVSERKKGNSEKGGVSSRKVTTFRERSETLEKIGSL
jgi:hypothetical protein